ncbi:hypothetical protein AB1Y20_000769 [Prymnesium parvum]
MHMLATRKWKGVRATVLLALARSAECGSAACSDSPGWRFLSFLITNHCLALNFAINLAHIALFIASHSPSVELLGSPALGDDSKIWDSREHPDPPTAVWGKRGMPLPTNEWWENAALADGGTLGENPFTTLPYVMKALKDGLHAGLPGAKSATKSFVLVDFADSVSFGSEESLSGHQIESYDPLAVNLQWSGNSGGTLSTPLVRGMPYVTAQYDQLTPLLSFNIATVVKANGQSVPTTISEKTVTLEMSDGTLWQLYVLPANGGAGVEFSISSDGRTAKGKEPFNGTIRTASATKETTSLLDHHSGCIPLGGKVEGRSDGQTAQLEFTWRTEGKGELLMMALPHHFAQMPPSVSARAKKQPLTYNTMKGDMFAVLGDVWRLEEPVVPIGWGAPRPIAKEHKEAIRKALQDDREKQLLVVDPYGSGKEMAAVARLVLIAEELEEKDIAKELRMRLAGKLEMWLSGGGKDGLLHDRSYGGVVSSMGLDDRGADFGAGWYNDHHFHFGYFIYAAAVVAKENSTFVNNWGSHVLHLLRDIANPSPDDKMYPYMRYKDWFVGHSWASGLFPSASSRNQESASEAINAWYGVLLYGIATGDKRLEGLGQLLLATELRSAWTYYQILDDSIYPEPFASNKLVGCLWSLKADFATWFGDKVEWIYGIQIMPVTPASELLLRSDWLKQSKSIWSSGLTTDSEQWRAFFIMANAILDPGSAWDDATKLQVFDAGNTQTNTLYWVATRSSASEAGESHPPPPLLVNDRRPPPTPSSKPAVAPPDAPSGGTNGVLVLIGVVVAVALIAMAGVRFFHARSRQTAQVLPAQPGDAHDYQPL